MTNVHAYTQYANRIHVGQIDYNYEMHCEE